jgi:hypothetical protein
MPRTTSTGDHHNTSQNNIVFLNKFEEIFSPNFRNCMKWSDDGINLTNNVSSDVFITCVLHGLLANTECVVFGASDTVQSQDEALLKMISIVEEKTHCYIEA